MAGEKLGLPTATVHLAPMGLKSVDRPPVFPTGSLPAWLPGFVKRFAYRQADRTRIRPAVGAAVERLPAALGLPPIRGEFLDWWNSPDLVLGLFPEWYAVPRPGDWPTRLVLPGFPLYDEGGATPVPAGVEEFLRAGGPPVVVTFGSAMRHAGPFFAAAAAAIAKVGRRGILLTPHRDQVPESLPAGVAHFDYVPFGAVLPRSAALIHHGGIGTAAQALAAGIPHVVMPMSHDQPDNAAHLTRLGVGRTLWPKKFTAKRLAATLAELLDSADVAAACRDWRDKIGATNALTPACVAVEKMAA